MENLFFLETRYPPYTVFRDGMYFFSVLPKEYYPTGRQLVEMIGQIDETGKYQEALVQWPIFIGDLNNPIVVYEPAWTALPDRFNIIQGAVL
jgi:hypothetical protein